MSRRKTQTTKAHAKSKMRKRIAAHVAALFPGCTTEFVGQQSRAKLVARTFGFRVKDQRGKYKSISCGLTRRPQVPSHKHG